MKFVSHKVKNVVGKGENAYNLHFPFSHNVLEKKSCHCVVRLIKCILQSTILPPTPPSAVPIEPERIFLYMYIHVYIFI